MAILALDTGRQTTGELKYVAGFHYICVDCGTSYPMAYGKYGGSPMCNGYVITLCPWCRPDSEPYKHGRAV